MFDPWEDWCRAHQGGLGNLLIAETDQFLANVRALQDARPTPGARPDPREVVAGLLFDVAKIAAIAESCFGPSDDMTALNNLLRHVSNIAARWGVTGPVEAFMATVAGAAPATTPDTGNDAGGPPDIRAEKSTERAVRKITEWILTTPAAPPPGRGRPTILYGMVAAEFRRQGRPIGNDTARKYTGKARREWESKNPGH